MIYDSQTKQNKTRKPQKEKIQKNLCMQTVLCIISFMTAFNVLKCLDCLVRLHPVHQTNIKITRERDKLPFDVSYLIIKTIGDTWPLTQFEIIFVICDISFYSNFIIYRVIVTQIEKDKVKK